MKEFKPEERIRLLLVEDDWESGTAVADMLTRRDVAVTLVPSAEEAIEDFHKHQYDVIVADIRLKRMSGVDLLRTIRAEFPDFPVILLTGFDSLDSAIHAVRLGAQDYILKPLDNIDELLMPVTKAVRSYRLLLRNQLLESRLRESEAQLRTVLENSRDIAYRIDLRTRRFDYVSPSVKAVLGRPQDFFHGRSVGAALELLHPDDRPVVADYIRALKRTDSEQDVPDAVECRVQHKAGPYCWLSIRHGVMRSPDDRQPVAIVGNARDITAVREAEAQERRLRQSLARVERLESLTVMAGSVAHDLNNILNPMVIVPDLITRRLKQAGHHTVLSDIEEDLTSMARSARRAADVIYDLLTLSRSGKEQFIRVDLNSVVREYMAGADYRRLVASGPDVVLETDLDADIPAVRGSPRDLIQVLMNLVINAFDVTPQQGRITVRTREVNVTEKLPGYEVIDEGRYVVISVADSGGGIPGTQLERIFEPFYSTKQSTRCRGTGLGLTVVHSVIKDHGGYIDVRTEPGRGTEFLLYLPVDREAAEAAGAADLQGNGTVLLVDDAQEQLELGRKLLADLGYVTLTAPSGRKAVELVRSNCRRSTDAQRVAPFDLVVLDMIMEQDFDGLDTFREIARLCPRQRCIIVSGHPKSKRVEQAQALGVGQFLTKPFTRETLGRAVKKEVKLSARTRAPQTS